MSKLDELLRELCPNGVKYKKLVDAVSIERGKRVVRSQLSIRGKYPVYQNSLTPLGYHTDYNYNANTTFIIVAGAAGEIGFSDKAFWAADDCLTVVCPENVLNRYIYHLLLNNQNQLASKVRKASIPRLSRSAIENLVIPLPHLDVQREIVRMLDSYTESVVELQRQLTAELTARKTQYAYYRDKLLQYRTLIHEYEIGEVCDVSAGGDVPKEHFSKEKSNQYKVPVISNGCGLNALYGYTDIARVDKPAVTVAARGTIGYAEYRDYPYFPIIRLITLIPKDDKQLNAKYLYYSLEERHYKVPTSGILQLTVPVMKKEKVAIPSLDVQNRIVNVLDNFEKICSDLNIGLPAEIEARQKQYEYYRDKFLTFAKTGNTILSRAEQSRAEQSRAEQSRAEH